jgi:hypothetical protein
MLVKPGGTDFPNPWTNEALAGHKPANMFRSGNAPDNDCEITFAAVHSAMLALLAGEVCRTSALARLMTSEVIVQLCQPGDSHPARTGVAAPP